METQIFIRCGKSLCRSKVVTMPDLKLAASKTIDHSQRGQEAMLDARERMEVVGGAQGIFCALLFFNFYYCLPQEKPFSKISAHFSSLQGHVAFFYFFASKSKKCKQCNYNITGSLLFCGLFCLLKVMLTTIQTIMNAETSPVGKGFGPVIRTGSSRLICNLIMPLQPLVCECQNRFPFLWIW